MVAEVGVIEMADDSGSGLSLKVLIILMIVMIIVTGIFSYVFMTYFAARNNGEQSAESPDGKNEEIGPTYTLGEYVVNLSGTDGYQFIRADVVVEVNQKKVIDELERRSPQIKDIVIATLREQEIEDIEDPAAGVIKDQILNRINQVLTTGEIQRVWFTQFVVQ